MGITGLIPFLEKSSKPTNVKEFSGGTVAIDAYCWLHKGVFSCAEKLARGDNCDMYVSYCMKYINMLLSRNIKPILVFDGQRLPAKMETEHKRRESREVNRKKAAELMRMDRGKEAQTYLRRCIDITHEMALNLIRCCRARNVDCIVAPYEADAELAFLNMQGIVDCIITEDSDLLLFGAKKVLFKMDVNGNGLLIEQSKLCLAMGVTEKDFSFEKFRYMCILSGCDYLASLPGIGLVKACRFVKTTADPDIHRAISRISLHLNMPQLIVTKEYRDRFMDAEFMFKYQPVYDPKRKKIVPLTSLEEDAEEYRKFSELISIKNLTEEQANNLAYGNLDPANLKQMDHWKPSQLATPQTQVNKTRNAGWNTPSVASHPSIWDENFKPNSWTKTRVSYDAPNALCPNSKAVRDTKKNVLIQSRQSLPNATREDFEDQIEQLKNAYRSNDSLKDDVADKGMDNENDVTPKKKTHVNPFMSTQKPKSTTKLGVFMKFAQLFKTEERENSSSASVNSRYFMTSPSAQTDNGSITKLDKDGATDSETHNLPVVYNQYKVADTVGTPPPLPRSPLKSLNRSVDLNTSKSPQPSPTTNAEKSVDSSNSSSPAPDEQQDESPPDPRKRRNPFAMSKSQQEKKVCSAGMLEKLDRYRRNSSSSFFKWANQSPGATDESLRAAVDTSAATSAGFKYPKCESENSECNTSSDRILSQPSEEDEGFCSPGTSSFDSDTASSQPSTCTPALKKSVTSCRRPGLKKKPAPKQLNLFAFAFKPAHKLTL